MSSLQHGVLTAKMSTFGYNVSGFYFTPIGRETKCFLLDPSIDKSLRTILLSELLSSGAFTEISYRDLINLNDSKRFKLALVNMQSSFNTNVLDQFINMTLWDNYPKPYIDYVAKTIGQNPAERIKQCSGVCYSGSVPNIKSYDPFSLIKIYPKTCQIITENDRIRMRAWELFFNNAHKSISHTLSSDYHVSNSPNDALVKKFFINIIDNGKSANDVNSVRIPLSFRVPPGYIFSGDIYDTEKMLATWGLNIYDGACWEIALWLMNDDHSSLLDELRLNRKTTQFASIIGNNVNSQRSNLYLYPIHIHENTSPVGPVNPTVRTITYPYDPEGFAFKTISNYYSYNKSTIHPQQWNTSAKYWNKFSPDCGENSWFFAISPFIRKFNISNFKGYSGFISTLFNMMDINGGFYHSPINDTNKTLGFLSEDNISMYGALSHMKNFSSHNHINIGVSHGQLTTMMNGVERLLSSMADKEIFCFYSGKTWSSAGWQINKGGLKADTLPGSTLFAVTQEDVNMCPCSNYPYVLSVNVQTWSICSLQPKIIDKIFGVEGSALKMWNNLKQTCGRFNRNDSSIFGELKGFGYTNVKSSYDLGMGVVISTECTFGAMMACKVLKAYYGEDADKEPYSISSDLEEMETFMYTPNTNDMGDDHLLFVSEEEAYFNYANIRAQTGFGCFANPIPSIVASAWHIFYIKSFNPFVPNGCLLR